LSGEIFWETLIWKRLGHLSASKVRHHEQESFAEVETLSENSFCFFEQVGIETLSPSTQIFLRVFSAAAKATAKERISLCISGPQVTSTDGTICSCLFEEVHLYHVIGSVLYALVGSDCGVDWNFVNPSTALVF